MPAKLNPRKRRILRAIKIEEISAVDKPCQEDAVMAIMKRADPDKENDMDQVAELEGQVLDLEAQIEHLTKRHDPITKSGLGDAFDTLVAQEIRKGCPPSVAGQRVITKYGARPDAAQIRKSESSVCDFMAAVDAVMIEKRCSRTAAMVETRKRHPDKFAQFQEV